METVKTYIFYTNEGFTEDRRNNPTENCQILGWGKGKTAQEAFINLVKENDHFKEADFNKIICQELTSDVVSYFYLDNKRT